MIKNLRLLQRRGEKKTMINMYRQGNRLMIRNKRTTRAYRKQNKNEIEKNVGLLNKKKKLIQKR